MSEDTEVPKLKSQEPKIAVSENSDETRKTLKRNYCHVCKVQCTALKNFIVHQKGRKHLKKLKLKEDIEKRKLKQDQIIKTRNNIIKNLEYSSLKTNEQNSKDFKLHEANDSTSGTSNSDDKSMSNSKRQMPKYKNNHYNNFNNQNNYSRHQNSRYSYSNNYEGDQGYYYNERPKSAYTRWRSTHYQIPPPMHSSFNNYQYPPGGQYYSNPRYSAPFENEYFSGNRNASFMSHDYVDQRSSLPFSSAESENSVYSFLRDEISDVQELESSSIPSRNANKSSSKDLSNSLCTSETINSEQGSVNTLNQFSTSKTVTNNDVDSSLSNQISDSSKSKVGENKRLRTRSLSSSESANNDKKLKDKNEILSADSEGMPDQQKLKEYTTSLLETNPNRISLMIQHPSSHKEKAVLNHIMTSFSKTRRKENLTRKLRSNSLGSAGNNDDATLDIQSVSSESDDVSIIFPSEVTHTQTSSESDKSKCHLSLKKNGSNSDDLQSSELFLLLNKKDSKSTNSSQVLLDNQSTKKNGKNGRSKENSILSKNKASERRKEKNFEGVYPKKTVKRKSCDDDKSNKSKKQRSCDGRNLDMSCLSKNIERKDLNKDMTPVVNSINQPSDIQITPVSHPETVPVKEEVTDCAHINEVACVTELPKATQNQNLDYNSQISVETLIELFASGNVTVKKEYNDPVIDAIKGVDPNELIIACSDDSHLKSIAETNPVTVESNVIGSMSSTPVPNISLQENTNCINPVILGSTVDSDNITPVSRIQRTATPPSPAPTEVSKDQNFSYMSDASEKDSLSDVEKLNLISRTKTEFPHLITLIEKLQEISSQEEAVKGSITEAKSKINEYSNLLEEWKNKKKKLHNEEEELRKKRNDIIQLMQNAIKIPHDASNDGTQTEFLHEAHSTLGKAKEEQNAVQTNKNTEISSSLMSSSLPEAHVEKRKLNCSDSDEILILPSPVKLQPPEIIIVDDTEGSSIEIQSNKNSVGAGEIVPNFPNQGSSLYDTKNLTAHSTVVNCIVVFEDFVYTCSNDNTAKRYSLMDTSQSVIYLHASKNVTEIAVEKVQNEALVFTSCSNRILSLFIASNGTKIKTFFQSSPIKSICKGWGKFYAGMEDGTVNVYNWKYEEKEFAKTQNPAYRIATVHQGGLHVLIILSTDGHVSLRDAKTSLLIRFIKTSVKFPAWLTVHNDFVYLSSSDRTISVLDIQSAKVERKMQLNHNHATGLAVCDDNIFTISYSGIICCVNKDKFSDLTLFYGAGKTGLTCIHVYQNWVFTGNRKGDISVFRFDPRSRFSCKIGKCRSIYGSREDLAFHFELQHLKKKNLAFCQWEKCPFIFPVNYSTTDKINHLKRHILLVPRGSAM